MSDNVTLPLIESPPYWEEEAAYLPIVPRVRDMQELLENSLSSYNLLIDNDAAYATYSNWIDNNAIVYDHEKDNELLLLMVEYQINYPYRFELIQQYVNARDAYFSEFQRHDEMTDTMLLAYNFFKTLKRYIRTAKIRAQV